MLLLGLLPAAADNQAKSDYYFMEAMRLRALERDADAEALLTRAYELNPDPSSTVAKLIGFAMVSEAGNDAVLFLKGLSLVEKYVRLNPDDSYAAISLADYYSRAGNVEKAQPLYAHADSLNPSQPAIALRLARSLEMLRRPQEAIEVYRRIETREGKSPQLAFYISNVMMTQLADTTAALAEVEALTAALPGDTDALALAISAHDAAGRADDVMRLVARAIELEPDNEHLVEFCIQEAYDVKGIDDAFAIYENALHSDDLQDADKKELLLFFMSRLRPKDGDDIVSARRKAVDVYEAVNPTDVTVKVARGQLAYMDEEYAQAGRYFEDAFSLEPNMGFLAANAVRFYMLADEPDSAVRVGSKALATETLDDVYSVSMVLSGVYMNQKRYEEAAATLRALLDNPDAGLDDEERSEVIGSIADAEQNFKPAEDAAKDYEEAIRLNPANYMAKNNYAYMISEKGGDLSRAEELIDDVITNESRRPIYLDTAAWVAFKLGKYGPAIGYIDEAIAMERDEPSSEYMLHAGDIYFRAGMTEKAVEFWQKGLDTDPDSEDLIRRVELKAIPE